MHSSSNCIRMTASDGSHEFISLNDHSMHSYVPITAFLRACNQDLETSSIRKDFVNAMMATPLKECSWKTIKHIVDKVHRHVCGHSPYSDIKLLLIRNEFWNETVERYLSEIVEKCSGCRHMSLLVGTRKVSLSSMSRSFNELVCVDHFYLNDICVLHVMDSVTRYSA